MEHSYVGGEILASISLRNVDNPLRGQIVDSYIVAVGFKPTIRRRAQTLKGCSGDKGQRVEAYARVLAGICFAGTFRGELRRGSDESEQSCLPSPIRRLVTCALRCYLDVSVFSHVSVTHSFFSHKKKSI